MDEKKEGRTKIKKKLKKYQNIDKQMILITLLKKLKLKK